MDKKRVVIIEDEPIISMDFEKMIQEMGYEVPGKFRNGEKALEKINEDKPDLVLLDINLVDKLSGYEIAEELINLKVPFIVITGSSDDASLKRISGMKANGVLIKPIYEAEFKRKLNSVLDTK